MKDMMLAVFGLFEQVIKLNILMEEVDKTTKQEYRDKQLAILQDAKKWIDTTITALKLLREMEQDGITKS